MTIAETREKCKTLVAKVPRDVIIIAVLILASSASFGLGYLAGLDAGLPVGQGQGSDSTLEATLLAENSVASTSGNFVASKNGTKYYLPSCSGVDRISETNKVWFTSASAAVAAGYTPAANCKGL